MWRLVRTCLTPPVDGFADVRHQGSLGVAADERGARGPEYPAKRPADTSPGTGDDDALVLKVDHILGLSRSFAP